MRKSRILFTKKKYFKKKIRETLFTFELQERKSPFILTRFFSWNFQDLWNAKEDATDIFHQLTIDLRSLRFKFIPDDPIYGALAPRVGDIDLDGYPDLLLRMQNPNTDRMESHLLLNVPTKNEDEIIVNMNLTRGFVLRDLFLSGIPETIMATFFDLYENGKEDVILVQKQDDKYR